MSSAMNRNQLLEYSCRMRLILYLDAMQYVNEVELELLKKLRSFTSRDYSGVPGAHCHSEVFPARATSKVPKL